MDDLDYTRLVRAIEQGPLGPLRVPMFGDGTDDGRLSPQLRALFDTAKNEFRWEIRQAIDRYRLRVTVSAMHAIVTEELPRVG